MGYRIEGKDLVISGFENGIAESPYAGIADMRNIDTITIPGEAMVGLSQTAVAAPPVFNAVAYTAQNTGDTITVADTTGLYNGCALRLVTFTGTGPTTGVVYYVGTITATTFQLFLMPAVTGTPVAITGDGSGTLTTYQYGNQRGLTAREGVPVSYFVDRLGASSTPGRVSVLADNSNYLWAILPSVNGNVPANSLIFLGNIGGNGSFSTVPTNGVVVWKGYLLLFGIIDDEANFSDLWTTGPAAAWGYSWETTSSFSIDGRIGMLVSAEDENVYWTSSVGLGSLSEEPGETFDPDDTTTYNLTSAAIGLPNSDDATCIAELGSNLLIGGKAGIVYVWDKISLGFNTLIEIPELWTWAIVATNQNAYIFSGNRGRVYISNGSGLDRYLKISDYLTGTTNPYIRIRDASFSRNQIYFTCTASSNADAALTTMNGAWAIDIANDAMRMVNKITNSGYSGVASMVAEQPYGTSVSDQPPGNGLLVGWRVNTTFGVDRGSSDPYTNYESYIHTDMIPVGSYLKPFTPAQIEWKTSVPLGGNGTAETIRISYRTYLTESFTVIGTTTATGTSVVGSTTGTTAGSYAVSDYYQANFQKTQWVQLLIEMASNATTPTFCRLTEVRIRDWPST